MKDRDELLPLLVIRRYWKLVHSFCVQADLLDRDLADVQMMALPFRLMSPPLEYPQPGLLRLTASSV